MSVIKPNEGPEMKTCRVESQSFYLEEADLDWGFISWQPESHSVLHFFMFPLSVCQIPIPSCRMQLPQLLTKVDQLKYNQRYLAPPLLVIKFTKLGQLVLVCTTARCLCNSQPRVNICRRRARVGGGRARARNARCSISS